MINYTRCQFLKKNCSGFLTFTFEILYFNKNQLIVAQIQNTGWAECIALYFDDTDVWRDWPYSLFDTAGKVVAAG